MSNVLMYTQLSEFEYLGASMYQQELLLYHAQEWHFVTHKIKGRSTTKNVYTEHSTTAVKKGVFRKTPNGEARYSKYVKKNFQR